MPILGLGRLQRQHDGVGRDDEGEGVDGTGEEGHEVALTTQSIEHGAVGSEEIRGREHVDFLTVSCIDLPACAPFGSHTEIRREERGEDHHFGHDEDPKTSLADVLAFKGMRGGDLFVVADEGQVFTPPIGNASSDDDQAKHAQAQITQIGIHAREHVAEGVLEGRETHQEEHDTQGENDGRT